MYIGLHVKCPLFLFEFPEQIFEKKMLLNTKCVFWFSLQLLSETFLILRRTQRDIVINVHRSSFKVSVILIWISWTGFRKKMLLNTKCVFWFSLQLLSETFLIIRRTQRDIVINVHWSSFKVSVIIWISWTDFRKKILLNTNCVFWFSLQLLSETFLILRRTQRDIVINVHWSSFKVSVIIIIWISWTDFLKILKIKFN